MTRIKAADETPVKKEAKTKKEAKPVLAATTREADKGRKNPFKAIGGYFAGAWFELKQVRWPNRRATWSLTFAVLVFSAFFVVLILLLDALFKYLFQLILG